MTDNNAWNDEWLKAQQKFVESWSDMSKGRGKSETNEQSNLWANGLEMWRKAYPYPYPTQPETDQVINKCLEVGKGYFAMAEQIGKQVSSGGKPEQVVQQWLEQGLNLGVFRAGAHHLGRADVQHPGAPGHPHPVAGAQGHTRHRAHPLQPPPGNLHIDAVQLLKVT